MKAKRPTVTYADPDAVLLATDFNDIQHIVTPKESLFLGYGATEEPTQYWLLQGRIIKICWEVKHG